MPASEVPREMRAQFARQVEQWGYPRAVTQREVADGRWYTNGEAIVWYVSLLPAGEEPPPGFDAAAVLAVHGIAKPGRGRAAMTPATMLELERIARELGARTLYSLIPRETPNMPVMAMRRLLRRFGWTEDEFGSYKLLGGE